MFTPKIIFGFLSSALAFVCYIPYIRDIYKGKTKPHVFSWFIWGLLTGTAFLLQKTGGSGAGSWVTGISSLITFFIAFLGFSKGERKFFLIDWICLVGALLGMVLWLLTKQPILAIIILSVTDAIAYIPTFRKGYSKPFEETLVTWIVSSLKFVIAFFAFDVFSFLTIVYPLTLIVMNMAFVTLLVVRKRQLKK